MLKITGGEYRSRDVECPKGKLVRPTTSYARESIFNILGPQIVDARFLDIFAGCGIMGFEAISRGATWVQAVEKERVHGAMIEKNRDKLGITKAQHGLYVGDYMKWLDHAIKTAATSEPYDIIFLDPPFPMDEMNPWIEKAITHHILHPEWGILIWEHRADEVPITPMAEVTDRRRYGGSTATWMKAAQPVNA